MSERPITPEQKARLEAVTERNRLIQENGIPAPKSGTFGVPAKPSKKDE